MRSWFNQVTMVKIHTYTISGEYSHYMGEPSSCMFLDQSLGLGKSVGNTASWSASGVTAILLI